MSLSDFKELANSERYTLNKCCFVYAVAAICTVMRMDNRNHKNIIMLKKIAMLSFIVKITKLTHDMAQFRCCTSHEPS